MEPEKLTKKLYEEGQALRRQSRLAEAVDRFQSVQFGANKEHDYYPMFLEEFASLLFEAKQYEAAVHKWRECENHYLEHGEEETSNEVILARLGIGESLISANRVDEAISYLQEKSELGGRSVWLLLEALAHACFKAGRKIEARAAALSAIKTVSEQKNNTDYAKRFDYILK